MPQPADSQRLRELLDQALRACQAEVVRRLHGAGLALSVEIAQPVVTRTDSNLHVGVQKRVANSLHDFRSLIAIGDDSVPGVSLGFREQLSDLADELLRTTDLASRPAMFMPALEGPDAILARYLSPLARSYLMRVGDLESPDVALVDELAMELNHVCNDERVTRSYQVFLAGLRPLGQFEHRGVRLRELIPEEQGAAAAATLPSMESNQAWDRGVIFPTRMETFAPETMLEIRVSGQALGGSDDSTLLNRVLLALFLKGYEVASNGLCSYKDMPEWVSIGHGFLPSLVQHKNSHSSAEIDETTFLETVDLAHLMPDFSARATTSRAICLFRALRAFGLHWQESPFLDFMIALEAALLPEITGELTYRFSLYGALFLRESDDENAQDNFQRLKRIYGVRSKMVHGGVVSTADLDDASNDARTLVRKIVARAVSEGWPDPGRLDTRALSQ